MKKNIWILALTLILIFAITGCAPVSPEDTTPNTPGVTDPTEGGSVQTPTEGNKPAPQVDPDIAALLPILNSIQQVQVAAAGSSLACVPYAVSLLDWGVICQADVDQIRAAATGYLEGMTTETRNLFLQQLALVDNTYQLLLGETGSSLLKEAGCTDTAYPWSDKPVEAIEAIMQAAGLRQPYSGDK